MQGQTQWRVGIMIKKSIAQVLVNLPAFTSFKCMCLVIHFGGSTLVNIVCVYRPPGSISAEFLEEISSLAVIISSRPSPTIVCGDLNIHMDVLDCATDFRQLTETAGLKQHIDFPIHLHGHRLDLLISALDSDIISSII